MKHFAFAFLWALLGGLLWAWGDHLAATANLDHPALYCALAIGLPGIMMLRSFLRWRASC